MLAMRLQILTLAALTICQSAFAQFTFDYSNHSGPTCQDLEPQLPNPSFELSSCCPNGFSQLNCCLSWDQASAGTSDYYDESCLFTNWGPGAASLGTCYAGFLWYNTSKEYLGGQLTEPLVQGGTYTITLDFAGISSTDAIVPGGCGTSGSGPWAYPSFPLTIFGSTGGNLPFAGSNNPPASQFQVLGQIMVNPTANWTPTQVVLNNIPITATEILIGGPSGTLPGYPTGFCTGTTPFLFVDNLNIIVDDFPELALWQTGDPCNDTVEIGVSNPPNASGTYHWFVEGDEVTQTVVASVDLSALTLSEGDYVGVCFQSIDGWCVFGELQLDSPNSPSANFSVSVTCEGHELELMSTSTVSTGSIASWSWELDGANFGEGESVNELMGQPGEFEVGLTVVSSGGCTDEFTDVVQIYEDPSVAFSRDGVCALVPMEFTDESSALGQNIAEVNWTFGDTGTIMEGAEVSYEFAAGGDFTLAMSVESTHGCMTDSIFDLYVEEITSVSFLDNSPCAGQDTAVFSTTSDTGDLLITDYDWYEGGESIGVGEAITYWFDVSDVYDVTLELTTVNGCKKSETQPVVVPTVQADFDFENVCEETQVGFDNTSTAPLNALANTSWSLGQGEISDDFSATTDYLNFGFYQVELIQTSTAGCIDTSLQTIEVYDNPIARFDPPINPCVFDQELYVSRDSIPEGDYLVEYAWDSGSGDTFNYELPDLTYAYQSPGFAEMTYLVTTQHGCMHDTLMVVDVKPLPIVSFAVEPICLYDSISQFAYHPLSENAEILEWDWEFGDGQTSEAINPNHNYGQAGSWSAQLTLEDEFGCQQAVEEWAHVEEVVAAFSLSPAAGCPELHVDYQSEATSTHSDLVYWEWTSDDQQSWGPESAMLFGNPSHELSAFFDLNQNVSSEWGCKDTLILLNAIEVFPAPIVDFDVHADEDGFTTLNYLSTENKTLGAVEYSWESGDGQLFSMNQPSWYYQDEGDVTVTLTAWSENGCESSAERDLSILWSQGVFIPNAFTPNNDGINDVLTPVVHGDRISSYHFHVFNRWGDSVFQSTEVGESWSGALQRQSHYAPDGVYVYTLRIRHTLESEPIVLTGHITLTR